MDHLLLNDEISVIWYGSQHNDDKAEKEVVAEVRMAEWKEEHGTANLCALDSDDSNLDVHIAGSKSA